LLFSDYKISTPAGPATFGGRNRAHERCSPRTLEDDEEVDEVMR